MMILILLFILLDIELHHSKTSFICQGNIFKFRSGYCRKFISGVYLITNSCRYFFTFFCSLLFFLIFNFTNFIIAVGATPIGIESFLPSNNVSILQEETSFNILGLILILLKQLTLIY